MSAPPNFNRLARLYRWMEYASFGPWLWWCRCAFLDDLLDDLKHRRNALVLGDGDGRFTARLLRANPDLRVTAVDASQAMLRALLRSAGPHSARVQTVCADLRAWRPADDARYGLVVTHFFLDCLTTEECTALAIRLRSAVTDEALWVVSEFALPRSGAGRTLARTVIRALYLAFGWITGLTVQRLPDYHSALQAAGFTQQKRRRWLGGLLTSELWSAKPQSEQ